VAQLQKNRYIMEKVEALEVVDSNLRGEFKKVRKDLEFVIELVEDVGEEELKRQFFKKRKEQLMAEQGRIF